MAAAATTGRPASTPTDIPTPASNTPAGEVMARATRGVAYRRRSEVGDDIGEDLLDRPGVAGVVGGRVGRLGHGPQGGQVGVLAVADGEQPHRRGRLALAV